MQNRGRGLAAPRGSASNRRRAVLVGVLISAAAALLLLLPIVFGTRDFFLSAGPASEGHTAPEGSDTMVGKGGEEQYVPIHSPSQEVAVAAHGVPTPDAAAQIKGAEADSADSVSSFVCGNALPSVEAVLGGSAAVQKGQTTAPPLIRSNWVEPVASTSSGGSCDADDSHKGTLPRQWPSMARCRYQLCYHTQNRFLFFGNNWGRHSNQLTSLAAALVLGRSLNRTIIVPPLFPDHGGSSKKKKRSNGESSASTIELVDLYNISLLLDVSVSPFCVLSEAEFLALEQQKQRAASEEGAAGADGGNGSSSPSSSVVSVPAVCMTMRGIQTFPRHPSGFRFTCQREVFVKFKKDLRLFLSTAASASGSSSDVGSGVHSARVLTVPLMIYYASKVPAPLVQCVWRLLQPHPAVGHVMGAFWRAVAALPASESVGSYVGVAVPIAPIIIGVHMRSLEGSCASRVGELERHAAKQSAEMRSDADAGAVSSSSGALPPLHPALAAVFFPPAALGAAGGGSDRGGGGLSAAVVAERRKSLQSQCEMEPSYVLRMGAARRTVGSSSSPSPSHSSIVVIVADDGQQPKRVETLVAALQDSSSAEGGSKVTALRLRDVFKTSGSLLGEDVSRAVSAVAFGSWVPSPRCPPSLREQQQREGSAEEDLYAPIVRNRFSTFASLLFMQLDFWAIAGADVLVGNQLSTLSQNVCRRRRSEGRLCDNFVGVEGM